MIKTWNERLTREMPLTTAMQAEIDELRAKLAALELQEPVAYVRFSNGEVDYDADAVISNTEGDCMDESIEWLPVYAAAGAAPVPRMTGAALASQEPVAEVLLVDGEKVIDASMAFFDSVELGTKLYLAAGAAPVKSEPTWDEALRISELPDIDEAIWNLIKDGTEDNAVCLVRMVITAGAGHLLAALKRIDDMCSAPPNFSDATIQDIARAAIAASELNPKE